MEICLSQACTLTSSFEDDLQALGSSGCLNLEVWLTKLETHLKTVSANDLTKQLADLGIKLKSAAMQGGLLLSSGEARTAHWEHFKKRLDLCQRFGIQTIVLVPDDKPHGTIQDLGMMIGSLVEACQWAGSFDVRLALEFQSRNSLCANLETAILVVEQSQQENLGVCLDAFHYWTGSSKEIDLKLLTKENLAHVQLCDIAGVPREFAKDSDRVFPGEGDLELKPIIERLKEIGYERTLALEVNNPMLWKAKPSQVFELGYMAMTRFKSL